MVVVLVVAVVVFILDKAIMYLYQATNTSTLKNNQYLLKTVKSELTNIVLSRNENKDNVSSKSSIHGPKQADALHKAEMKVLRKELDNFPIGLREHARSNYLLDQNNRRRDLQDTQYYMVSVIEGVLKQFIIDSGLDYRKYKVGGYDKGTYGKYVCMYCLYASLSGDIQL